MSMRRAGRGEKRGGEGRGGEGRDWGHPVRRVG